MKQTLSWFVTSSADPEKVSLFIKSLVTVVVLFGLDATVVNQAGNYLASMIVGIGILISAGTGLWGLGRKVVLGRWAAN